MGSIDRSSMSMAAFNEMLNTEVEKANPTTHAAIIRDDNYLLIYCGRSRNSDSQWEIQAYNVVTHGLRLRTTDKGRASVLAVFCELFDPDDLTTDERSVSRAVRYGVPVAVAVDGKPAVASYLYARHSLARDEIAERMGVGKGTVNEYLSRFRRRGTGIPDHVEPPTVGSILPEVPSEFDPGQQIVADDGGDD